MIQRDTIVRIGELSRTQSTLGGDLTHPSFVSARRPNTLGIVIGIHQKVRRVCFVTIKDGSRVLRAAYGFEEVTPIKSLKP